MLLGGAGERGLRHRGLSRLDRRLRRHGGERLSDPQPALARRPAAERRIAPGADVQRQQLPHLPGGLEARPAGSFGDRAERLLHLAGGGVHGEPEPAPVPVRHGAGRRCERGGAACPGVSGPGERAVAGRPLPRLRCRRGRHGRGERRGRGGAEAPGGRPGRRGCDPRGDPRLRDQQRRRLQAELHRPLARRAARGGGDGAGHGGCAGRVGHLRRDARHGDPAGRSGGGGGADRGLRGVDRAAGFLWVGLDQDQHRPSRRGGGGRGPDQDHPGGGARGPAAQSPLRDSQPAHRLRAEPVLRQHRVPALAAGGLAAARRGQRLRHRRRQRAPRPGGATPAGTVRAGAAPAVAGAVGAHGDGARSGHRAPSRASPGGAGRRPGRHRLHPPGRAPRVPPPPRSGRRRSRRRGGRAGTARSAAAALGRRRRGRAAGGFPVPRPGHRVPGHGPRALPGRRRIPRPARRLCGASGAPPRSRSAGGPVPAGRGGDARRGAGGRSARPSRPRPAAGLRHGRAAAAHRGVPAGRLRGRVRAGLPPARLGDPAAGDGGLQPRRVRGGLPCRRAVARRCAAPGGRPRPADRRAARRSDAGGAAGRGGGGRGRGRGRGGARRRSLARRGRRAGADRARGHGGGGGRGRGAALRRGPRLPPVADLSRLPFGLDGAGGGALPGALRGDRAASAGDPLSLQCHRRLDHRRRGDGPGLLGGAPARHGAVRGRGGRAVARARAGAGRGRAGPDALLVGAATVLGL